MVWPSAASLRMRTSGISPVSASSRDFFASAERFIAARAWAAFAAALVPCAAAAIRAAVPLEVGAGAVRGCCLTGTVCDFVPTRAVDRASAAGAALVFELVVAAGVAAVADRSVGAGLAARSG